MAVKNQKQFQEAIENALKSSPLGSVVEKALNPLGLGAKAASEDDRDEDEISAKDDEIRELKKQLAEIQSKIDKLGD